MGLDLSRGSRMLSHIKGDKIVLPKGSLPTAGQGSDGDIAVGDIKGQTVLFAKYNNTWFSTALSPLDSLAASPPNYISAWTPFTRDNFYYFNHNLGSRILKLEIYAKDTGDRIWNVSSQSHDNYGSDDRGIHIYMDSPNRLEIAIGNHGLMYRDNVHWSDSQQGITSGELRVLAWRTGVKG